MVFLILLLCFPCLACLVPVASLAWVVAVVLLVLDLLVFLAWVVAVVALVLGLLVSQEVLVALACLDPVLLACLALQALPVFLDHLDLLVCLELVAPAVAPGCLGLMAHRAVPLVLTVHLVCQDLLAQMNLLDRAPAAAAALPLAQTAPAPAALVLPVHLVLPVALVPLALALWVRPAA